MSCQQAARLLTTNTATRIREDPYVFSDTVPTTPPILFNIQKSRAKLPKSVTTITTKSANQKLPLAQLNGFTAKTQASVANVVSATTTTNLKNVLQSQQQITKSQSSNVCIVRPQQHIQHKTLPTPTPSLWQTPLLLNAIVSPPTSPASLPSPTLLDLPSTSVSSTTLPPSNFHHTTFAQHLKKVGCIRKTPSQTTQPLKEKLNSSNDNKKVCIINSDGDTNKNELVPLKAKSPKFPSLEQPAPLDSLKHSVNDLNKIPVNVIYRKPQPTEAVITAQQPSATVTNVSSPKVKPQATVSAQKHDAIQPASPKAAIVNSELVKPNLKQDLLQPPTSSKENSETIEITDAIATSSNNSKKEKSLQTDVALFTIPKAQKRRTNSLTGKHISQQQIKKCRQIPASFSEQHTHAFAVVTYPEIVGFSSAATDSKIPQYCLQKHWLSVYDLKAVRGSLPPTCISVLSPNIGREERITQHKNVLRRQAMQLLSSQKLFRCPLQVARRRLICVDKLLHKYGTRSEKDIEMKTCVFGKCSKQVLPMTTHCYDHIGYNADQHLFLTCTAKFSNNSQCRIPVFDIVHDLPLCTEHARKRDAYNRIWHEQRPRKISTTTITTPSIISYDDEFKRQQQDQQGQEQIHQTKTYFYNNINSLVTKTQRNKRKPNSAMKPVGRPQKRFKKTNNSTPTPIPLSAVKHRKSSNTSLESIASNSHSSHSQPPFVTSATTNVVLAPPALAPLSGGNGGRQSIQTYHHQQHENVIKSVAGHVTHGFNRMLNFGSASAATTNEINQIVAQFGMIANDNNNSNSHTDFSSGLSSLPSADEILTQDMLSICENSSAYASSEDTGVGGLSETELMAGAHDAEEIPLGDTRLLEEHDLANVLNTLPVDAFNELFTAVRQDERDEVERALELAENNLKSLQQTIGSDSDFLGDFLDVNGHMLDDTDICSKMEIVSSVLHSPDTSGIDTATLFAEGGSSSSDGGRGCLAGITDIRGLVQT